MNYSSTRLESLTKNIFAGLERAAERQAAYAASPAGIAAATEFAERRAKLEAQSQARMARGRGR